MQGPFQIAGGFDEYPERVTGSQRTINMYVENNVGTQEFWLKSMAGFDEIVTAVSGTGRKIYSETDVTYVVIKDKFYSLSGSVLSTLGTLTTLVGDVSFSHNNADQIIMVDGAKGWIWDTVATTFTEITAAGFPTSPTFVLYLDGYFITNEEDSPKWHVSALNDGLTWDALNFASIQSKPDTLIGGATLHRRIYLFGRRSTEVWFNAGLAGFPFERDNNLLLEYGCAAPSSIASGYEMVVWLAEHENSTYTVRMTTGGNPQRISIESLEDAMDGYSVVDDAYGNIYQQEGHTFYELTFPTENITWVFDSNTGLWFERQMENGDMFKAISYGQKTNEIIMLAHDDATVYSLNKRYKTYGTENIRRERITKQFRDKTAKKIRINKFTASILPGVGNLSNEEDPKLWMATSRDGGFVYGNLLQATLGKIGERNAIARWHRLGTSGGIKGGDWIFKFVYSGETDFLLGNGIIDYEVLND